MKITVYTINDSPFCKDELDYLKNHNLAYEEKNLEINREFLTEMLAVSGDFKGVPVTKIEKDDGQISVLKGFTMEEFDKTLGYQMQGQQPEPPVPTPPQPQPPAPEPTPPVVEPTPPPVEPPTPPDVTPPPPVSEPSPEPTTPAPEPSMPPPQSPPQPQTPPQQTAQPADDPLSAILNDLQTKSSEVPAQQPAPSELPTIPSFPK